MVGWPLRLERKRTLLALALLLAAASITTALLLAARARGGLLLSSTSASISSASLDSSIEKVKRGDIKKKLLLDGELRAVSSRTVFATTTEESKITYMPPEGSVVKAGDRLVELDSSTIHDRIKDIEERIIAAENEIIKTRSAQESALRDMEVELSKLWLAFEQAKVKARAPASVIARREFQENQLALEKSRTEYDNQIAKIEQKKKEQAAELQVRTIEKEKLEVQLNQARGNLDGMTIKAPSDGMVLYSDHWNWNERRKLQIGDIVWSGFPIIRLPDLGNMEVLANVNEVDGPKLSPGQRALIRLDSYPDIEITGSVKEISQTAVKASWMAKAKIFRVVISLDKTVTEIMKPGMSAQVSIVVSEHPSQLLVPRSAVEFEVDSPNILRLEAENQWRPIAITILSTDPVYYGVADNGVLKEGDSILLRRSR
ncbi:MAG TPA: HlyD family efflux transporter periplasmic adaptor subunit [Blastocatellia bacterium]|nr:HlyD family efflux transporter periplasmic adaptor subunit [Blastocatellia bacterium]